MKYHQPFGVSDPNAPYINGDPTIGQLGSIPPAESIEYPQREIINFIELTGELPTDADLAQLARAAQSGVLNYAADIGTQNQMLCVLTPPTSVNFYPTGLQVHLKVLYSNINDTTHTTLTLDAGGGARNVVMPDGSMPATNTMVSGGVYPFTYDGTRWQLGSAGISAGPGATFHVNIPYVQDSGIAANHIRALFSPAITSVAEGLFIAVRVKYSFITAACDITINALPPYPIAHPDGTNVVALDAIANQIVLFCFDGVNFQMIGTAPSTRPGIVPPNRQVYGPGSGNFTALITGWHRIKLNGGGGAGGSAGAGATTVSGGAAGGGYVEDYVFLTNGTAYPYVVGYGGSPNSAPNNGNKGGDTTFQGVYAYGGAGGIGSAGGGYGIGGGGGGGYSIHGYQLSGGSGWSGIPQLGEGGAGGQGAGFGAPGGSTSTGAGIYGIAPGGGGSGCVNYQAGGVGGGGQLVIEW